MILIIEKYGQYSNRLIQDMRIRTFCRKYGITCLNLTMGDMEKYFNIPNTPRALLLLGNIIRKIVCKLKRLGIDPVIHAERPFQKEYLRKIKKPGIYLIDNWGLYDIHEEKISLEENRKRYCLKPEYYQDNAFFKQLCSWKEQGFTLVGVHIRRGDYKTWANGVFYYEDEVYLKYIEKIRNLLANKKIKFIIFTVDECHIEGTDIVFSHEPWYIDQFLLGKVDYSFGPPSTFRRWSSYIYQNKSLDMTIPPESLELKDFSVFDDMSNLFNFYLLAK